MDNLTAHKASEYDQKVRQTIPFYDTIHAEVTRLVKLIKPEVKCWVDTGCGTGRVAEQALRDFPAAEFILADPSEAMLVQARGRLTNCYSARLTILPPTGSADLESHVANNTADVITAIQCHHLWVAESPLRPKEHLGREPSSVAAKEFFRHGRVIQRGENHNRSFCPGPGHDDALLTPD